MKRKKEKNEIKKKITKANQEWCDWKFQMHWNKHKLVNPSSYDEKKSIWCAFKKNKNWVDHSKSRPLKHMNSLKEHKN